MAAAVNAVLTSAPVHLSLLSIKPRCAECDRPIDPRLAAINDGVIGWPMADGSQHLVALCPRCIASLDSATHSETVRRLTRIRARAFS
jgi:hypothetical protein